MDVPILLQPPATLPCISVDGRPRLDVSHHEGVKRFCRGIDHGRHSTAPESLRLQDLDRDTRQDLLPLGTTSRKPRLLASKVGFVHLHLPTKALPIRTNQHRPQAMQDSPHGLVGANPQGPLQTQRRDPVFSGCKMPTDRKPNPERSAGTVEDGTCHHCRAATASRACEPAVAKSPSSRRAACWADEAAKPSQPFRVAEAVRISREPSLELSKGLRVVAAGAGTFHRASLSSTPVKGTRQHHLFGSRQPVLPGVGTCGRSRSRHRGAACARASPAGRPARQPPWQGRHDVSSRARSPGSAPSPQPGESTIAPTVRL